METDIHLSDLNYLRLTEDNTDLIGISTGIGDNRHDMKNLFNLVDSNGWLIGPDSYAEWRFAGYRRIDDEVHLIGPFPGGKSLAEVLDLSPKEGLDYLRRLVLAMEVLEEKSINPFAVQTGAVFFLDDGRVLILPPPIMDSIRNLRSLDYRLNDHEAINHPYLKSTCRHSYTIAMLVYRILTGEFPFTDESEEGLRNKIRSLNLVPMSISHPEVRTEISQAVTESLKKPEDGKLSEWSRRLDEWIGQDLLQEVTPADKTIYAEKAIEEQQKQQKSFQRRLFFEKNGKIILWIAVLVAVGGSVAGGILRNVLAPRRTRGFTPIQVVEAFYDSKNTLDHELMEDCVIGNSGKAEINETIHIFLIEKQYIVYDQKDYVVPADDWAENGRPVLNPPYWVHGVADLSINEVAPLPEPEFLVEYERWTRPSEDSPIRRNDIIYAGWKIKDRVSLRLDKDDWVIQELERLEVTPIEN